MEIMLAVALVVMILILTRGLHQLIMRAFVEAALAPARSTEQIVQRAVADLDREYEDLVRRYR